MTRLVALFLFLFLLAPNATEAGVQRLDVLAKVKMLPGGGASLMQAGTFRGAPLGSGKVRVRTFVGQGRGSVVRFEMWNSRGKIRGTGDCAVKFKGSLILYNGTAKITTGSGAYRTMRGRNLKVSGRGTLSSESFSVRVSGRVRV